MRDKEYRIDSNWKFSCVQLINFSTRKVCQVVQELKSNFNWLVFVHHMNHELEAEQSCKDSIKLGSGWEWSNGSWSSGHKSLPSKFRLGLTQAKCCITLQLATWLDRPNRWIGPKNNEQHLPSAANATALLNPPTFSASHSLSHPLLFCKSNCSLSLPSRGILILEVIPRMKPFLLLSGRQWHWPTGHQAWLSSFFSVCDHGSQKKWSSPDYNHHVGLFSMVVGKS